MCEILLNAGLSHVRIWQAGHTDVGVEVGSDDENMTITTIYWHKRTRTRHVKTKKTNAL